jgi:hypothetical protein
LVPRETAKGLPGWAGLPGLLLDGSDAHRHHDVFEAVVAGDGNQRAGIGVVETPLNFFSVDVVEHVEQITDVEADIDDITGVVDFNFFDGFFLLGLAAISFRLFSPRTTQPTEFFVGQNRGALHGLHQRLTANLHVVLKRGRMRS